VWLCKLNEWGMLRRSFVPPEPIRDLRALTRLRARLTQDRVRHQNRIEKILEDVLLTELLDVTAAQKAELPWRRITTLTEMPRSAGRTGRDLDLGATESGHTAPNSSPASSSLLLVSTSPTWP